MFALFALNVLELNDAGWTATLWAGGEFDAHCANSPMKAVTGTAPFVAATSCLMLSVDVFSPLTIRYTRIRLNPMRRAKSVTLSPLALRYCMSGCFSFSIPACIAKRDMMQEENVTLPDTAYEILFGKILE